MGRPEEKDKNGSAEKRIGKDEMNLIEHPIALLATRPEPGQKSILYELPVRGRNNEIVKATWEVTGSEKYGLPFAGDEDIVLVLLEITKEQGFTSRTVHFSRYELVRRIKGDGFVPGGKDYKRIEDALKRLNGVSIHTNHWFDNKAKKYATYGFHILEEFALYEEPSGNRAKNGQIPIRHSFVTWDKHLFASFTAGYIKSLDLDRYFRLQTPIARRLYRYLDKKFFDGKPQFEIGLRLLAHEHIGISRNYRYDAKIKDVLKKAHQELVEVGFLTHFDYRPGADGTVVVYHAPPRNLRPLMPPSEDGTLAGELVVHGVSKQTAVDLVEAFGEERVRRQLECFPYRRSKTNPAGLLIASIEKDYPAPAGYAKAQQERERKEKRSRDSEEEGRKKGEREVKLKEAVAALSEGDALDLRRRAEEIAREKYPHPAQLADRGRGVAAWNRLVNGEMEALLLPG